MIKAKLDKVIRTIPDFPKDGISFKDITPLLLDASLTNDIIENIPSSSVLPAIVNYQLPDSLNILAAYFMNSEKIISVGNFNNRQSYIDFNGNYQDFTSFPSGQINPTSSRGPNRLGYLKPDVSANGNLSFAAAALSTLSNPGLYDKILQDNSPFGNLYKINFP